MSLDTTPLIDLPNETLTVARREAVPLEELTSLMKLLSDPTRLSILMKLSAGERNVSRLCVELELPQPTVSHHLGLLRASNVINNRRDGKQVFYSLGGRIDRQQLRDICVNGDSFTVRISPRDPPA